MGYSKNEIILSIKDINKSFDKKVILRDISFDIRNIVRPNINQGQIISLIGKSGSGKSTLFNIISGLLKPDSGTVWIGAESKLVKEGDIGVVFQNSYIHEWRKVKEIFELAINKNKLIQPVNRKDYIEHTAFNFDIHYYLDKYPEQLSGGQRQRVAIAEQILNGHDFILLDEPFSGLDTLSIDKVTKILTDLSLTDEYKTIIIVSHDLVNSLAISDSAFILAKEENKEGATITKEICLAEMGLAWREDIKDDSNFRDLIKKVKTLL